jgi:hypothetical protein
MGAYKVRVGFFKGIAIGLFWGYDELVFHVGCIYISFCFQRDARDFLIFGKEIKERR